MKALPALLLAVASLAHAQWREGQAPTVTPPPAPAPAPAPDVVAPFTRAYAAAGQPRVVLLWNRTLSDDSAEQTLAKTVIRDMGTVKRGGSSETTSGSAGKATISESTQDHDRTRTITSGTQRLREGPRRTALSERDAILLERAFVSEMSRGGMRFVDRSVAMRTTAASQHRGGGDHQLIETDALLKHGDMLMEVVLVEDPEAPARYGFDVRVKDVRRGTTVASVYSRGVPVQPPQGSGAWVAGANGYEFKLPPAPPLPGPAQVGTTVARDVMQELQGALRR